MRGEAGGDFTVRSFTGGAFAENTYLVRCTASGGAIIVDPGAATGALLQTVRTAEIPIEAIVLTHAHLDHVEGLAAAKRATGAPVYLHPDDLPLYRQAPAQAEWFGMHFDPLPDPDRELRGGETFRFGDCGFEVRHTPGHAPGHVILVGDGAALTGDCVFAGSIGRTDLPGGELATLMHSIREQILTLPDETVLHSGHGPDTTVGHERVSNPFLTQQLGGSAFA